ncbi:MAG: hypothetical protein ACTHQM_07790 [Thermoanaerobaculia bacterium]
MRNEMIGAIVRRAIEHPEFRKRLIDSPQDALESHGFALEAPEMAELDRIRESIGTGSNDDVEQKLVGIAEQYGVHPRPE